HLVILQCVVHVSAFEQLFEYPMTQEVLVAHAIGWDCFQSGEEIIVFGVLFSECLKRNLRELRVVTVIAVRSGALRKILQKRLIIFLKERVLLRYSIRNRRHLCKSRAPQHENQAKNQLSHNW